MNDEPTAKPVEENEATRDEDGTGEGVPAPTLRLVLFNDGDGGAGVCTGDACTITKED